MAPLVRLGGGPTVRSFDLFSGSPRKYTRGCGDGLWKSCIHTPFRASTVLAASGLRLLTGASPRRVAGTATTTSSEVLISVWCGLELCCLHTARAAFSTFRKCAASFCSTRDAKHFTHHFHLTKGTSTTQGCQGKPGIANRGSLRLDLMKVPVYLIAAISS